MFLPSPHASCCVFHFLTALPFVSPSFPAHRSFSVSDVFSNKHRRYDVPFLFALVNTQWGHKPIMIQIFFSLSLFLNPGGELSGGFQLCGGRPDIPGVYGQCSVVSRASRHHIRWRAQELSSKVRDETTLLKAPRNDRVFIAYLPRIYSAEK